MPSKHGQTAKSGRYGGRGDLITTWRFGEHAPDDNTPFSWLPAVPHACHLYDGEMYWDMLTGGYVGEGDARFTTSLTEGGAGESTITYVAGGLKFTTDDADNDAVRIQMLMSYTPAAKKRAVAACRVSLADVLQSDFMFGFYATQTDPVGTEPLDGAYYWKTDGAATTVGRTNDAGATGSSTSTLLTLVNDTAVDIVVGIDPTSASAGTVYFAYKLASALTWSQVTKTTDFPRAATRFSALLQAGEAAAKNCTFGRGFVWWEN